MTDRKLITLVNSAVALHREIAEKTELLKALKADLVQHARENPEALAPIGSGGKRFTAKGSDGCIARVSFPSTGLISEVEAGGDRAKQLHVIAGDHFRRLFATVKSYQLVENFRAEVASRLPAEKAAAVTKLCESDSSPRVSFEAASHAGGVAA